MHRGMGCVVAGVAVVGALLSACGGPAQAGSAAIIGDDVLPLEQVQSSVASVLASVPAGQRQPTQDVAYARAIVTNDVRRALLTRLGSAAGITVPDTDINAFIEQSGGAASLEQSTGLTLDELRRESHDLLLAIALGRRAAPGLVVTADVLTAGSRDDAAARARILAAGGAAADALFTGANSAGRGQRFAALNLPADTSSSGASSTRTVILGTGVGETVAYQPDAQQPATWSVFRVTARRTDATPSDPTAVSKLGQSELVEIGDRLIQPLAESIGVRINPRYGVWDPISLSAVSPDRTAGVVLPA